MTSAMLDHEVRRWGMTEPVAKRILADHTDCLFELCACKRQAIDYLVRRGLMTPVEG